ncbi:MAG: PAS domain-containing sensor histidine kinase [Candidatus Promineifilaceae bacterium]
MQQTLSTDFLAQIPVGIYRLDQDDKVIYANDAWLAMHGFASLSEVVNRPIHLLYHDQTVAQALRDTVSKHGWAKDIIVELKRPNGEHFWASVCTLALRTDDGVYAGREGIVKDVTERQIHRRIAEAIPAGYFAVERLRGVDVLIHCNPELANMLGFDGCEALVGLNVRELYHQSADFEDFISRIDHADENAIRHQEFQWCKVNGDVFWVEVDVNLQRDAAGHCTGWIGVVRDLSKDEPLQRLRKDLGNVLHTFTTGLIAVKSDIDKAILALGPNPFPKSPSISIEHQLSELAQPVAELRRKLQKLLDNLSDRPQIADTIDALAWYLEVLTTIDSQPEVFRAQVLADCAGSVVETASEALNTKGVPRQPMKLLRAAAFDVLRIFTLSRMHERISDILQMEHELRSLRAYVTAQTYTVAPRVVEVDLWRIVQQSMRNLHDFADSRGVEFRPSRPPFTTTILADERDIMRVVTNVLHNAVKYSWSRQSGVWVDVKLIAPGDNLLLEIQNYGLPIPADEINGGLIYEFGYRSRLSTDRGRVGTGIGLADAKQTLRRYGGTISLDSRPAYLGGDAEKRDPFITTATIRVKMHN